MAAATESDEELSRFSRIGRFTQDAAANGDSGVGAENHVIRTGGHRLRLLLRETQAVRAWKLSLAGVFVDVRGQDQVRFDSKLRQQFLAARASRSQDETQFT